MVNDTATRTLEDPASAEITVVLGENQSGTRAGVRRALENDGLRVLAEAASSEDAVQFTYPGAASWPLSASRRRCPGRRSSC